MDDHDLIARTAAGDDQALRELFLGHAPWLAARLRTVLPASDVEDVLQETFLAVWKGARNYRPEGPVGAWLWGIARRQAAMALRRSGPAMTAMAPVPEADLGQAADPAESALLRAELEEAVATLGPQGSRERALWQLLYVEDRSIAEVAELTGVPPGTVKSRASRVRRLLRAALPDRQAAVGGNK
jgi:RNA polymerase sigma-70 factor (ECF subfamily)